jgi:alcohol dehydrogenase
MLGATHACANPLTSHYGTAHGAAIAMLLPSVVRWNGPVAVERYRELLNLSTAKESSPGYQPYESLARRLEKLATTGGLGSTLRESGVDSIDLQALAAEAAEQWTGSFNPRPFDIKGAMEVYEWAF